MFLAPAPEKPKENKGLGPAGPWVTPGAPCAPHVLFLHGKTTKNIKQSHSHILARFWLPKSSPNAP